MAEISKVKQQWIYSATKLIEDSKAKTNPENLNIGIQRTMLLEMIYTVDALIWGRDIRIIRVPLTFIDAIKLKLYKFSWMPEWFMKRYPVRLKKIDLKEFYPLLPCRGTDANKLNLSDIEKTEVTYGIVESVESWPEFY